MYRDIINLPELEPFKYYMNLVCDRFDTDEVDIVMETLKILKSEAHEDIYKYNPFLKFTNLEICYETQRFLEIIKPDKTDKGIRLRGVSHLVYLGVWYLYRVIIEDVLYKLNMTCTGIINKDDIRLEEDEIVFASQRGIMPMIKDAFNSKDLVDIMINTYLFRSINYLNVKIDDKLNKVANIQDRTLFLLSEIGISKVDAVKMLLVGKYKVYDAIEDYKAFKYERWYDSLSLLITSAHSNLAMVKYIQFDISDLYSLLYEFNKELLEKYLEENIERLIKYFYLFSTESEIVLFLTKTDKRVLVLEDGLYITMK